MLSLSVDNRLFRKSLETVHTYDPFIQSDEAAMKSLLMLDHQGGKTHHLLLFHWCANVASSSTWWWCVCWWWFCVCVCDHLRVYVHSPYGTCPAPLILPWKCCFPRERLIPSPPSQRMISLWCSSGSGSWWNRLKRKKKSWINQCNYFRATSMGARVHSLGSEEVFSSGWVRKGDRLWNSEIGMKNTVGKWSSQYSLANKYNIDESDFC